MSHHPLVLIMGPTAVGKTDLSLFLAEHLKASLLNCDSVQMVKGLDIGSAKPDFHKHRGRRFFLYDVVSPPEVFSAGQFRERALRVLQQELACRMVLGVGGSGFYLQALLKGMYPVRPVPTDLRALVRDVYEKKGLKHLYFLFKSLDPEGAACVAPQDKYRVLRGLDLLLSEQKSLSHIQSAFQPGELPYRVYKVGLYLPREKLLHRVTQRVEKMLQDGWLKEVEGLLDKNFTAWPLMNSVGYRECVLYLNKKIPTREELKTRIVRRTMKLAKKQMLWFKRSHDIHWHPSDGSRWEGILHQVKEWARRRQ